MGLQMHVVRRGQQFLFRVRIPTPLIERFGRRELRRSLLTGDPALARRRGARLTVRALALFDAVLMEAPMTDDQLKEMIKEFYEARLDEDLENRRIFAGTRDETGGPERPIADWGPARTLVANWLAQGDYTRIEATARNTLDAAGIEANDSNLHQVGQGLMRAWIEALDRCAERDHGTFYGVPRDPLVAAALAPPPINVIINTPGTPQSAHETPVADDNIVPAMAAMTMLELAEACIEEKKTSPRPLSNKTVADYRNSASLFDRVNGSIPVGNVTRQHTLEFKRTLLKLPARFKSTFRTKDPLEAIAMNAQRKQPHPTLDAATINNKYLSNIRAVIEWGRENGAIRGEPSRKLSVAYAKNQTVDEERDPFSVAQLNKIFHAPLFTGARSDWYINTPGDTHIRDYRYWTPLLAIHHGIRLNEAGQLEVEDVRQIDGVWCLSLISASDPDDHTDRSASVAAETDGKGNKRGKSKAARRTLPLHEELIRLGFLDYVADMRLLGHKRLFPDWNIGADGYYSSPASKFYQRIFRNSGVKTEKTCFHSFRHCYKNALRCLDIKQELENYLMGHADSSVSARYGSKDAFLTLAKVAQTLAIEGLDLSHLKSYRKVVPIPTPLAPAALESSSH